MEHKDVFLLEDIIDYCNKIDFTLNLFNHDKHEFNTNPAFENACSFQVFQIGELANSLSDRFKETHSEMPWHQIVGMRNLIAHEYGDVDKDNLWHTINIDIPKLKAFCEKVISS